jgi:hypothetical protein
MFSFRRAVGFGAATLWRWVLRGSGLLGVVVYAPSAPPSALDHFNFLENSMKFSRSNEVRWNFRDFQKIKVSQRRSTVKIEVSQR